MEDNAGLKLPHTNLLSDLSHPTIAVKALSIYEGISILAACRPFKQVIFAAIFFPYRLFSHSLHSGLRFTWLLDTTVRPPAGNFDIMGAEYLQRNKHSSRLLAL